MNLSELLGIIAITAGLLGAVLNALLFWVINKNRSIDKKCALVYQNLAAVDIFNCFVIPLCYLSIKGHIYDYNPKEPSNSILYLLFGGTVNIPYMMLILLSVARVMIFKYQMSYNRQLRLLYIKILCLACWILAIGSGVGIWLCCLLTGTAKQESLVNLLKVQSSATQILVIASITLIFSSLVMLHQLTFEANKNNVRTSPESADVEQQFLSTQSALIKELASARRTFSYFLVSVLIWSSFPFSCGLSFSLCGPNFNSTSSSCKLLQARILADPKLSYAITQVSLCGMSIANSVILLRQKSFKSVLIALWTHHLRCNIERGGRNGDVSGIEDTVRVTLATTMLEVARESIKMHADNVGEIHNHDTNGKHK